MDSDKAGARGDYRTMNEDIGKMMRMRDSLSHGFSSYSYFQSGSASHASLMGQKEELQNRLIHARTEQLQRQYQLEKSRIDLEILEQQARNRELERVSYMDSLDVRSLDVSIMKGDSAIVKFLNQDRRMHTLEAASVQISLLVVMLILLLILLWFIIRRSSRLLELSTQKIKAAEAEEKVLMNESTLAQFSAEMALVQARTANRKAQEYLAAVSHEVRTPLNAIMGTNQILATPGLELSEEEKKSLISSTRENSRKLTDLISKVLQLSRLESGCFNPTMSRFNLGAVCDEALAKAMPDARPGVSLSRSAACQDIWLVSDRTVVFDVLSELLVNSCRFTEEGSVTLDAEADENYVTVTVKDTGCGVPVSERHRIFDPFEKIDSFSEGLGLGLTYCRAAVEIIGGVIDMDEDYAGSGALVRLGIPLDAEKEVVI